MQAQDQVWRLNKLNKAKVKFYQLKKENSKENLINKIATIGEI